MKTTLTATLISIFVLLAIFRFVILPIYRKTRERKKMSNLEKRIARVKADFIKLGLEHRDILKYYFDEGLSSNWGLINRERIVGLNLKMKQMEEDIDIKSKWLDLESVEKMEWAIIQAKAKIDLLKMGIKI
jgi:hypothetical protein